MELYFTCPVTLKVFASENYSLEEGHSVVEVPGHGRELKGQVVLTQPCPLCGTIHRYEVEDIICPFTGDTNEE
ncbi:MAG: hypothetical protein COA36_06475 [Desulfotalea sp.]|nr:MAG: hypothetical protein COA36_06475 [Desulfotalea sp.]